MAYIITRKFRFPRNLPYLCKQIIEHFRHRRTLQIADYKNYFGVMSGTKYLEYGDFKDMKSILYPLYLNPNKFQEQCCISDWYSSDDKMVYNILNKKKICDMIDSESKLKSMLEEQVNFIKLVSGFMDNDKLNINRYQKFMHLRQEELRIVPTMDIQLMWNAHMLKNDEYIKSEKKYFGHILPTLEYTNDGTFEKTEVLWRIKYGENYINRDSFLSQCVFMGAASDAPAPRYMIDNFMIYNV